MALSFDVDEFFTFYGDMADDTDEDRATMMLQLASNLFWQATKIDQDPTDPNEQYLVKFALYDMAIQLLVVRDQIDEVYSPFTSERVGSYNYSKMVKVVSEQGKTGAVLFDRAVTYFNDKTAEYTDSSTISAESVFQPNSYADIYYQIHPFYGVGIEETDYKDYRYFNGPPM